MNDMNFYDVGYGSHEECPSVSLIHEVEFTEDQFEDIVSESYAKAWKISKWKKYNEEEWKPSYEGDSPMKISCEYLLDDAIKILCDDYGFSTVKYKHEFSPFGWASVEDSDDWGEFDDPKLNLIREKVQHLKIQEDRENRLGNILDKKK